MKVSYYPGCSLHSTAIEYDMSTRKVLEALGVEYVEVKDWICCGSTPAHQADELMSVALPVKNLAIMAENDNLTDMCVPCASCYSRLRVAQEKMKNPETRKKVEDVIEAPYPENVNVMHALDLIIEKVGIPAIKEKIISKLNGMKVVCYYGCLMTRPPKATGKKECENPMEMEELMEELGAKPLDWNMKTFCCGAASALTQTEIVLDLTREILDDAVSVGAEAIVVGCPLCHANTDGRQKEINAKYKTDFDIPVFYFTELLGLCLGIDPKELGIDKHLTEAMDLIKK